MVKSLKAKRVRAWTAARWLVATLVCVFAAGAWAGPKLYIMDCGTIVPMQAELFSLTEQERSGDGAMVSPCYLVVHPRGTLLWDVGQVPDDTIADDGSIATASDILQATRRLRTQLATIGYSAADIDYLAMSHYHSDHTANANEYAGATWIVQEAEYDAMFADQVAGIQTRETYEKLRHAKRLILPGADHDVFGDGSVVIKFGPGHTPGHQMLFLQLDNFGPLLLCGDLYHYPEERTLDRVPTFDADAAQTRRTRQHVELFLKQTGAEMWIQHDPATNAGLKQAPAFYD
ncbi:MAG: N-acyl homoserine lactonase family protein [Gammaproteobacteria bacterium]|nr:N-acyl homoserine lactonase family protein [Gammaproteobacteria bacterium]